MGMYTTFTLKAYLTPQGVKDVEIFNKVEELDNVDRNYIRTMRKYFEGLGWIDDLFDDERLMFVTGHLQLKDNLLSIDPIIDVKDYTGTLRKLMEWLSPRIEKFVEGEIYYEEWYEPVALQFKNGVLDYNSDDIKYSDDQDFI